MVLWVRGSWWWCCTCCTFEFLSPLYSESLFEIVVVCVGVVVVVVVGDAIVAVCAADCVCCIVAVVVGVASFRLGGGGVAVADGGRGDCRA